MQDGEQLWRRVLTGRAGAADHPSSTLNPRYVFENFIVGGNNRFAYASAVAVAEHPGERFNPLFIWGGAELGTPHLLQAIGNQALRLRPGLRVCYVGAERFVRDLARASQCQCLDTWRADQHGLDMLLIDDIESIAGEVDAQQELYSIFMQLHGTGKQIVLAGDRPPKAITGIDDRLRSRFEWGLVMELQPPDLQTRIALLQDKAENQPVPVPKVVIDYIAQYAVSTIREPEGALMRVTHMARELGRPVTLELAIASLDASAGEVLRATASLEEVPAVVVEYYRVRFEKGNDVSICWSCARTRCRVHALAAHRPRHGWCWTFRVRDGASGGQPAVPAAPGQTRGGSDPGAAADLYRAPEGEGSAALRQRGRSGPLRLPDRHGIRA